MPGPFNSVNAFYAIGQHDAIGFCPFSIDSLDEETSNWVRQSYDVLGQLTPLIMERQGKGLIAGLLPEGPEQRLPQQLRLGDYILNVSFDRPTSQNPNVLAGGVVMMTGPDEYLFAETGLTVTFDTDKPGDRLVGILSVDEGKYVDGQWRPDRRLNGDQTHQGRHLRLPPGRVMIQRIKLYRYR